MGVFPNEVNCDFEIDVRKQLLIIIAELTKALILFIHDFRNLLW